MFFISGVQSGPEERRLINDLLDRYQTLERPVFNESEPLNLKFGLTLQQIIDVVSLHHGRIIQRIFAKFLLAAGIKQCYKRSKP